MTAVEERTLPQRFWEKVEVRGHDECWAWAAAKFPAGYGSYSINNRTRYAGLVLDHTCRNRACVNPAHLRAVSHRDNILADGSGAPAAANARKTHCHRGHLLAGTNLKLDNGKRQCRACRRVADLRRYHERRRRVG